MGFILWALVECQAHCIIVALAKTLHLFVGIGTKGGTAHGIGTRCTALCIHHAPMGGMVTMGLVVVDFAICRFDEALKHGDLWLVHMFYSIKLSGLSSPS
jgi:hypothetical protein